MSENTPHGALGFWFWFKSTEALTTDLRRPVLCPTSAFSGALQGSHMAATPQGRYGSTAEIDRAITVSTLHLIAFIELLTRLGHEATLHASARADILES
jgi:hypothetical protein